MSDRPERAWAVARALAGQLSTRSDLDGVAVTGSLARGDLVAGSDIDLWVLGKAEAREELRREGFDVTLLVTTEAYARSPDCALRFELADAFVLHDPRGAMARAIAAARANADGIRRAHRDGLSRVFGFLADELVTTDDARHALAIVREAARRVACLFVFTTRGYRVPKWRHFAAVLFPADFELLTGVLRPVEVDVVALLAGVRAVASEDAPSPLWPWPDAAQVERYLQTDRREDAVVAVRQSLPPVPGARLRDLSPAARDLFSTAHGLSDEVDPTDARKAASEAAKLLERLRAGSTAGGARLLDAIRMSWESPS